VPRRRAARASVVRVAKAGSESMTLALSQENMTHSETLLAVEELVAQWLTYSPDTALRLGNHKVGGVIEGNRVDGWLLLGNGVNGYSSPATIKVVGLDGPVVKSGGEDLQLVSNSLAALKANLPGTALNADQALVAQVNGHARITLSGNRFEDAGNCVTASNLVAQGNTWLGNDSDLGYAVVDRAAFTGNLVEDSTQEFSRINATVSEGQLASAGNLLLNVMPMRS